MRYKQEDIIEIFIQEWLGVESAIKKISKSKDTLKKYYQAAVQNKLQQWRKTTKGQLALILIYDQAPRAVFEDDDPDIYSTDKIASKITTEIFQSSEYKKLSPLEIMFAFFPYHHSENLKHQKIANMIFKELYEKDPKTFEWIYRSSDAYNKIIAKFSRFPHRNKILGRVSVKEEKEFLEMSTT